MERTTHPNVRLEKDVEGKVPPNGLWRETFLLRPEDSRRRSRAPVGWDRTDMFRPALPPTAPPRTRVDQWPPPYENCCQYSRTATDANAPARSARVSPNRNIPPRPRGFWVVPHRSGRGTDWRPRTRPPTRSRTGHATVRRRWSTRCETARIEASENFPISEYDSIQCSPQSTELTDSRYRRRSVRCAPSPTISVTHCDRAAL